MNPNGISAAPASRSPFAALRRYVRADRAVYANAVDGYLRCGHWETPPAVYDEYEAAEAAVPHWAAVILDWYIARKLQYLRRTGQRS
jgi:hypothetical protein